MKSDLKCPKCGQSYYKYLASMVTAVYYPPIYKDGVNINSDRNSSISEYECLNCGCIFKDED